VRWYRAGQGPAPRGPVWGSKPGPRGAGPRLEHCAAFHHAATDVQSATRTPIHICQSVIHVFLSVSPLLSVVSTALSSHGRAQCTSRAHSNSCAAVLALGGVGRFSPGEGRAPSRHGEIRRASRTETNGREHSMGARRRQRAFDGTEAPPGGPAGASRAAAATRLTSTEGGAQSASGWCLTETRISLGLGEKGADRIYFLDGDACSGRFHLSLAGPGGSPTGSCQHSASRSAPSDPHLPGLGCCNFRLGVVALWLQSDPRRTACPLS